LSRQDEFKTPDLQPIGDQTEVRIMDFRVGAPPEIGRPADGTAAPQGQIEARVLAVRPVRARREKAPERDRRRDKQRPADPRGGRVLVLMIPEGHRIPPGIETGGFRVFLRFLRR